VHRGLRNTKYELIERYQKVSYVGWVVLLICFLAGGTLFFSVNTVALRIFSRVKLQEAFKATNKKTDPEDLTEQLVANAERLILSCSLYRLIFNMCILLLLLTVFATLRRANPAISDYVLTFIIAISHFQIIRRLCPPTRRRSEDNTQRTTGRKAGRILKRP
jgi:Mg2+/Co2+ transporter CorB